METTLENRSALGAIIRGERTAIPPPKTDDSRDSGATSLIHKHLEWDGDCCTQSDGGCIMTEQDAERLIRNPPPAAVRIKGVRTGSCGDLSLIFGGAKSRKTSLAIMMAKDFDRGNASVLRFFQSLPRTNEGSNIKTPHFLPFCPF